MRRSGRQIAKDRADEMSSLRAAMLQMAAASKCSLAVPECKCLGNLLQMRGCNPALAHPTRR